MSGDDEKGRAQEPAVQVVDGAAREFLDGVRAALSDLPPGEVDEILDDVRAHLAELSGELGVRPDRAALAARLGTPQAYAGELRAAAGYPPAPPAAEPAAPPNRTAARLAVLGLVAGTLLIVVGLLGRSAPVVLLAILVALLGLAGLAGQSSRLAAVAELPELRRPLAQLRRARSGFLGELQPAWWVLRAVVAAAVVAMVVGSADPLPVLLLAVLAVPLSVWLGRHSRADRRWLWLVAPLNALAACLLVIAALSWTSAAPSPAIDTADYYPGPSGLQQNGELIRDIRPVDAAGNPLTGVYLFDQDGRPIEVNPESCYDGYGGDPYDSYDSGDPSAGAAQPYPRGTWEVDPDTGRCVLVPPVPLVVAVPTATAAAAPTSVPPGAVAPTGPAVPPAPPTALVPAPVTPTG
ncbi:DUF1700 domain-containing protein [Pseudonocardia humida]|uniref:Proline-rich protein n=1 Tax=Pseudonocardia humida TaxID=2800819 RepID=A0ABT0ZUI5_9PSEU|nr:hypothetical protein [Pseudonocardia humida]MCO1654349.1 hypothetical protein [Pseudonocardia humida]